ncbi:unnamed protein product [Caenorhabditis angaria]|uniref:Uncharacterized protein n=1 Tax=Caenorhabditis angaria TaxID=860376 RepID=A0A9P1I6G4_9PELO|nr:unnamed protein product [Caenorhabditis angaria]
MLKRAIFRNTVIRRSSSEVTAPQTSEDSVEKPSANSSTVYRPPYYRKPHQHHTSKHMLQDEFLNTGDATGAGVRLFDYYKTAEMVNSMPTIKEKVDLVSPYERPWTRAEKTWRRDWHPTLMATRKAWGIPQTPMHFDTLQYYQYLTKTRVEHDSLDDYYQGLLPPYEDFQTSFLNTLKSMEFGDGLNFDEEQTQKLLGSLIDDAMGGIAHNVTRLAENRVAYDVESEAFWIRSGFSFLYDVEEVGTREVVRKLNNYPKYIGDDRRKLGELAFVHRDKLAAQIRSKEALAVLHSLDSENAKLSIFDDNKNDLDEEIYSPKVYNLWPDQEPLWQCPGYHVDSGETHSHGILGVKSLRPLRERIAYWMGYQDGKSYEFEGIPEAKQMFDDAARSQAVVSMFTTLCAQAHAHGFTQYTDVTRPFTSQLILSDGINFFFAVGQLNTLAINVECEGFVNDRTNFIRIEGPFSLFDIYDKDEYQTINIVKSIEGKEENKIGPGLNHKVLERITQMLMKQ